MGHLRFSVEQQFDAVVALSVGATRVTELLQKMGGRPGSPTRWFIVSTDMDVLSALETQWGKIVDITAVGVPDGLQEDSGVIVDILLLEGVDPLNCLWLIGPKSPSPPFGATAWDAGHVN